MRNLTSNLYLIVINLKINIHIQSLVTKLGKLDDESENVGKLNRDREVCFPSQHLLKRLSVGRKIGLRERVFLPVSLREGH